MIQQAFNVTVFFKPGTRQPAKYRNVIDLKKCVNYCNANLGSVYYVNLYHPKFKNFIRREWQIDFKNKAI
jgi:hypothetical protein